jgi:DNA-binding transcriptional LysR family regulator
MVGGRARIVPDTFHDARTIRSPAAGNKFTKINIVCGNARQMAITITQLTAFLAVTRGGSVTAAADELVVTQPSVSSAIAALGRELGCELFERSGRGIRLTDAGRAFEPFAADLIGLLGAGRQAAREAATVTARRLRIAAVTTAAESFVPPLMRSFSGRYPQIELGLDVGNREEVLDRVRAHTVDVAILGTPPTDERLIAEPLMDNEIVCICAPEDPDVKVRSMRAADLTGRPWLLREPGSGTRVLNEQFLAEHGLAPATLTLGSNGAIKQAARVGLGVSLLSRAAVEVELASGRLAELRLRDGPVARPWFVLHSAIGPKRETVEQFVGFARTAVR